MPGLEAALDAGEVAAFQLRLPGASDDQLRRSIDTLMPTVQARGTAFLVDGRPDLAVEMGCDGVHLGAIEDYAEARRLVGGGMIGVSCGGSRHLGIEAAEAGADYVSFGAFFPSTTKPDAEITDPDILAWWAELMESPCVAVGGITVENCRPLIETRCDFLAVSAGVWAHSQGPAAAVAGFLERIAG